ncbi:dolichol phosphate-mannose biosynthesis regulatory protein-like [Halichondria panicea]|uniref:dolichol phosphate-mannose biosynthesis regulatory protein-like n=1 Tax=Halichondria panicea TaxID=6063 RepID=UPI00312B6552
MATVTDRLVGSGLISVSLLIFTYYTLWVMVLPFVEEDHVIHSYFLPRWYAVALPVVLGVCLLAAIGVFVGVIIVKDNARKKAKKTS